MNYPLLIIVGIIAAFIAVKLFEKALTAAVIIMLAMSVVVIIDHYTGTNIVEEVNDSYKEMKSDGKVDQIKDSFIKLGNFTKDKLYVYTEEK